MALFVRQIMALNAFIEKLQTFVITLKDGGMIKSANFQEGVRGFRIRDTGDAEFMSVRSLEFASGSKGYLPVNFVYFQLRGMPAPSELFAGVWENISSQFAGLFFRVEGGDAAPFGSPNQAGMIQSHVHPQINPVGAAGIAGGADGVPRIFPTAGGQDITTHSTGGIETRPVNTTIRVWIRRS